MFEELHRTAPSSAALAELLAKVQQLPRVGALSEVDPEKIYLGYTAMPPEAMIDQRSRKALFGPFESRAAAEAASALMREFCHECGTGLIMGDVMYGNGQKLNNALVLTIEAFHATLEPADGMDLNQVGLPPAIPRRLNE